MIRNAILIALGVTAFASVASAQLNQNCVVNVLNRTVQVNADGTWVLPNIPANFGPVRARATCVENGVTRSGESAPFLVGPNGAVDVPRIVLGQTTQIPYEVTVSAPTARLTAVGQTVQLNVTGLYWDGSSRNLTAASTGTFYTVSNPALATVSPNGLVTARASGTVFVQAQQEGAQGIFEINVAIAADSDGDGMSDEVELQNGLNPNNPVDALEDLDRDGLTNVEEVRRGTGLRNADSDGDGIVDGEEAFPGADGFVTNPLAADTDGDGVRDALEIATGSDPTNPNSVNLARALSGISVSPNSFVLTVSSLLGTGFRQLSVQGRLTDGTTIDLTPTSRGTNYLSSNLQTCSFGAESGRVFGGADGTCVITVSNSGFQAQSQGVVRNFAPRVVSSVVIPGFANNVDVVNRIAYVAAGGQGLQVVSVADPSAPRIIGSLSLPGNANDVRVAGRFAYVAAGSAGLRIVDVQNPAAPVAVGSVTGIGDARDVVVAGQRAYVASSNGLHLINIADPLVPFAQGHFGLTNAQGVAVDAARNMAVVVAGSNGIRVLDVTFPGFMKMTASILGLQGDPRDVELSGNYALVADFSRGLTPIDLTDPANPVVRTPVPTATGGRLNDLAVSGRLAFGAEVFFVNGVPVFDVADPSTPLLRTVLDFSALADMDGHGIAVDNFFVYMTGVAGASGQPNGIGGTSRLFIGQHSPFEDTAGVAPGVTITSPAEGFPVERGLPAEIQVSAVDDVAVASVTFSINGVQVFTDTEAPFAYTYQVPANVSSFVVSVRATDFGGNVSAPVSRTVPALAEVFTTVTGRVLDTVGSPVSGASVTCLGRTGVTAVNGSFSIPNVSVRQGDITCTASAGPPEALQTGVSATVAPVRGGNTDVGDIQFRATMKGRLFHIPYPATPSHHQAHLILLADQAADFTVTGPGLTRSGTVSPGNYQIVEIPAGAQVLANQTVESKSLVVTATSEVAVLVHFEGPGESNRYRSREMFAAVPVQMLGTSYVVAAWADSGRAPSIGNSQFTIVAPQDATTVTITPSCQSRTGQAAGVPFTVTLSAGSTYAYQCVAPAANNRRDVTGSLVSSSKPVGVVAGNRCAETESFWPCSAMAEMIFPVGSAALASEYFSPAKDGDGGGQNVLRIVGLEDGTQGEYQVPGLTTPFTLNRGQAIGPILAGSARIVANRRVSVLRVASPVSFELSGANTLSQLLAPSTWRTSYRVFNPLTKSVSAKIVVPDAVRNSIKVNGVTATLRSLGTIPNVPTLRPTEILIPPGESVVSADAPFSLHIFGDASGPGLGNAGFAYPAPF